MTKDEVLKLAIEALENLEHSNFKRRRLDALIAINQALAQPDERQWVGLTDEEIWSTVGRIGTADSDVNPYQILNDARAIEQRLKEKNI